MEIKRIGSEASVKGPAEYFTGTARIDPLFQANAPARAAGASVTFEPGARTAWHTHPLGQILIVTAGCGWAQREGGPIEEIHPGDVIRFLPGEKHWHGASPTTAITHIAIQEQLDGKLVDWMEKVTDNQYEWLQKFGSLREPTTKSAVMPPCEMRAGCRHRSGLAAKGFAPASCSPNRFRQVNSSQIQKPVSSSG
jgi:quercetin dioxygenase-like cupin family protein